MMSLTIRKIIVLGLIGIIFLTANILVVANWIGDPGIAEKAGWLRKEFLTGTAIAVILALLVLLVSLKGATGKAISFTRRCPVYDKRLIGSANYCGECGTKVESRILSSKDFLTKPAFFIPILVGAGVPVRILG